MTQQGISAAGADPEGADREGADRDGGRRDRRPDESSSLAVAERMVAAAMPVLLFTVLRLHQDGTLERIHSSRPGEYPVGGRKSTASDLTPEWHELCVQQQLPYVGTTAADVQRAFADHELIGRLGCGSFINAPVVEDGRTVATLCILAGPGSFGPDEVAAAQSIAHGCAWAVLTV